MKVVPVILSGGTGSRLWPLSRELHPKQLLALVGGHTLLQETVARLAGIDGLCEPVVVCNEEHRFLVAEQLREISQTPLAILLEPVGRNTAPAVAVAALAARSLTGSDERDDVTLLVLPADHVISDRSVFQRAVVAALEPAARGKLVTFGVVPDRAETGYGYIKAAPGGHVVRAVERFVEKPDRATAETFLESGDYFWNSGMFVFRCGRYLEELGRFSPDILEACERAYAHARRDLDFIRLEGEAFAACRSDSIDYAVMEKTRAATVVALDAGWSDVGNWSALYAANPADERGNVLAGDVVAQDTRDSYVYAGDRLVTVVGLRDTVVIETADAVLVAPKDRAQDVKAIVERLRAEGREEVLRHRRVYRPWGFYDSVDKGDGFEVKRLTMTPGAKLSLQTHEHRAEHWVVVRGQAEVTRGGDVFVLEENQSAYIPIGVEHRLANTGKAPLEIIEVRSGSYLGEDDVVRLEDVYGRADRK